MDYLWKGFARFGDTKYIDASGFKPFSVALNGNILKNAYVSKE